MLLIRILFNLLKEHYQVAGSDPRTKDLPVINSYGAMLSIMIGYVYFVRVLGPKLMKNRKPYNVKLIMQCYNLVQVALNLYIFVGGIYAYVLHPKYNWYCMNVGKDDFSHKTILLRKFTYLYFISKCMDLLDTVFFVLRKKYNQITYLHIYHHTIMLFAIFVYHNIVFATQFTVVGLVNSFIHVLMYTYYFLAAMKTKFNLDAWKPRMTELQIIQFLYNVIKFCASLFNNWCGLPYFWLIAILGQNIYMIILFMHFYWNAYIVKKKKKSKTIDSNNNSLENTIKNE